MAQSRLSGTKKKMGRPPVGSTSINVRLPPAELARLDEWRAEQPDSPSRPKALRRLARTALDMVEDAGAAIHIDHDIEQPEDGNGAPGGKARHKKWWAPLLNMKFDDPEQEAPFWSGATNNLVLKTPFPGIRIKAWAMINGRSMGVFVSGTRPENVDAIEDLIRRERRYLLDNLPKGTIVDVRDVWPIILKNVESMSDVDRRSWLARTLNIFANVLRPRLRKWYLETQG